MTKWYKTIQKMLSGKTRASMTKTPASKCKEGEVVIEDPIILNRAQEPLCEHNNVPAPILTKPDGELWWVLQPGYLPRILRVAKPVNKVIICGDYSKGTESVYLDGVYPRPLFTGPIPEPPKPEEGV